MTTEANPARGHWKDLSISYEEALSRLPEAYRIFGVSGEGGGLAGLAHDVGARLERVLADLPS